METIFYYVYLTTNLLNGKQYVGDRSCNCEPEKDKYLGSGTYYKRAEKLHKKQNFKKEILNDSFKTRQEAFDAQARYIIEYNTLVPNGYNISPKGGNKGKECLSQETKNKISNAKKGTFQTEETKRKRSESMIGKNIGKKRTEEAKIKYSNAKKGKSSPMKGKKWSAESKKKMSLTCTGKKTSEEIKKKISITMKNTLALKKKNLIK